MLAEAADVLDVFGMHYGNAEWIADAVAAIPLLVPGRDLEHRGAWRAAPPDLLVALRARRRPAHLPFIYHTVLDDSEIDDFKRFGTP